MAPAATEYNEPVKYVLLILAVAAGISGCARDERGESTVNGSKSNPQSSTQPAKPPEPLAQMPPLNDLERNVIQNKGTERPFSGEYWDKADAGVYVCRQCGAPLYLSDNKFESSCGWPSFDDEIRGAVRRQVDADGMRTEILCARCGGHLGHVFTGEGLTEKNTRHCVNSASMKFIPRESWPLERAIFAGGCFWGMEHELEHVEGILDVRSGYTGGRTANPTYREVCTGRTGHAEAVEVLFDPRRIGYEQLARLFFEVHDPTQVNRQGPDVGSQYRSGVFYTTDQQKQTAEALIEQLRSLGYQVATAVEPAGEFYPAEAYHQDYLDKHPDGYTCHRRVARFEQPAHR